MTDSQPVIVPHASDNSKYMQAIKSIDFSKDFQQVPCARKALLFGISGGVSIGAIRLLFSKKPTSAVNWAVLSFAALSITAWHDCRRKLQEEVARMKALSARYSGNPPKPKGVLKGGHPPPVSQEALPEKKLV